MQITFPEFTAKEEQNLLISLLKYRPDFEVFTRLDRLFQKPIPLLKIPPTEDTLPKLYLFTHFHLYFSISQLMRAHLSESFASTRKAIDATLSAYEMILHPETIPLYIARNIKFQSIKGHISRARKNDSNSYPLAEELIELHSICSEYGSHADVSSFLHRSETKEENIVVQYFQFPQNEGEYHLYYAETLLAYTQMLIVFTPMLTKYAQNLEKSWEEELNKIHTALKAEVEIGHKKSDTTNKKPA